MSFGTLVFLLVRVAITGAIYGIALLLKPKMREPFTHSQPQIVPIREPELGMEAINMDIVNEAEDENRRLAKKTGHRRKRTSNISANTRLQQFRTLGDRK
ncbi:MAG: hypothetical protein AAFN63_12570 [Pseudomonadota bacterium]